MKKSSKILKNYWKNMKPSFCLRLTSLKKQKGIYKMKECLPASIVLKLKTSKKKEKCMNRR